MLIPSAALLLALSFSAHASYAGLVVMECDNCATVGNFANSAKMDAESRGLAYAKYAYWVINPVSRLIGRIDVRVIDYEPELNKWYIQTTAITGTHDSMVQAWREMIPDDEPWVAVPSGTAGGYVSSTNTGPIADLLHQIYQGKNVSLNMTQLVIYANGDTAEFQLTDQANQTWTFVHGSNRNANGKILNDDCTYGTQPSSTSVLESWRSASDYLHNLSSAGASTAGAWINGFCENTAIIWTGGGSLPGDQKCYDVTYLVP